MLAFVPSIAFWCFDAYYLGLERLYRKLYADVVSARKPDWDLLADTLMPKVFFTLLFRPAVAGLHLSMIGVILLVSLARF